MIGIKFVGSLKSITYLCHMYLITTFKILVIEYPPIYWMSEFSCFLILVLASALRIPYRSGPNFVVPVRIYTHAGHRMVETPLITKQFNNTSSLTMTAKITLDAN